MDEIKNHPSTDTEIQECIKDLKVLGSRELKYIDLFINLFIIIFC